MLASPHRIGRHRAALTLTELLIAIALLSVLAVLLMSVTAKIRDKSKAAHCLQNMRQIGVAANLYFSDSSQLIPLQPNTSSIGWLHALAPYLNLVPNETLDAPVLRCPSQGPPYKRQPRSYRWNLSRNIPGESMSTGSTTLLQIPANQRRRLTLFSKPAQHAMLFDIIYTGPATFEMWKNNNNTWGNTYDLSLYPPERPGEYPRPHYGNHAVNTLYYDGHVAPAQYPLPYDAYYWTPEP